MPPQPDPEGDRDSVRERTLSSLPWFAVSRFVVEGLALVSSVLLARLLTPSEIGRAVLALICFAVASSVLGEGLISGLTQRKQVDARVYAAASWIGLAVGVALTLIAAFPGAWLVGQLVDSESAALVRQASPFFLLFALTVVPRARLQRELDFTTLGSIEALGSLAVVPVSVGLAAAGVDGRAIVIGALAGTTLQTVLLYRSSSGARPRFDSSGIKSLMDYGVPASLSSLIYTSFRNIDYAVVGAVLSPAAVGIYFRAYSLGYEYQGKISGILLKMGLSIYSRARDVEQMRNIRTRITRVHAVVIFPLLAILGITAPLLIPFVYGSNWESAVVPTQILAGAGCAAAVLVGTGPFILAMGRPRVMLVWNVWMLFGYGIAIGVSVGSGLRALCWAVLVFQIVNFVLAHVILLQGIGGIPFTRLLSEIRPAAVGSVVTLAVGIPLMELCRNADLPTIVSLAAVSAAAGGAYLTTILLAFPDASADLRLLLSRGLPKRLRRGALQNAE